MTILETMTTSPKNHDDFGHFQRLTVLNIMTSFLTIQVASIIACNYMLGSHAQRYQLTGRQAANKTTIAATGVNVCGGLSIGPLREVAPTAGVA